jgi:hypothetical protein
MYEHYIDWTVEDTFLCRVLINSDESKIVLTASDGHRYVWQQHRHDALAPRSVQPMEAHGWKKIKVNIWGAIH